MSQNILLNCSAGMVTLPPTTLNDRHDGGHLVVNPPREVWERSALNPTELTAWSFLVAATGRAMLDVLPQLAGGCINYWEAGNWALHDLAAPPGAKNPQEHRRVHLHVFGRSRTATDTDWRWGESPKFPDYVDSKTWAAKFTRLNEHECNAIREQIEKILIEKYGIEKTWS